MIGVICAKGSMSFKFNFNISDDSHSNSQDNENTEKGSAVKDTEEVFINEKNYTVDEIDLITEVFYKEVELRILNPAIAEERVCSHLKDSSDVVTAVNQQSDLIQGVYEGGLKVWECGVDLVNFMINRDISFQDKAVLELGCGAGLPGIYSMTKGAQVVDFQDYNKEVLEEFTVPNVDVNKPSDCKCQCRFVCGDWASLPNILTKNRYDIILTAETIYNIDNYNKLVTVFDQLLKQDGHIYISAKSYYFGVGGGTRQFELFLKNQGKFTSEVMKVIDAGVPREILKITRIKQDKT